LYTDIHCHILPGLDDGAENSETALEMARKAWEKGTRHIIATPHVIIGSVKQNREHVRESINALTRQLQDKGLNLTIYPGCEVFICPDLPDLYEKGHIFTLNGSRYMLIELPMMEIPSYTEAVLYELQLKGIVPIIAHPERNQMLQRDMHFLQKAVERGILAQVNSGSITGLYGKAAKRTALKMIEANFIHFVASDAHTNRSRTTNLSKAAKIVQGLFGQAIMETLFINNGMTVIASGDITRTDYHGNAFMMTLNKIKLYFQAKKGEL
jgi:protein-tyrosine phosphatase